MLTVAGSGPSRNGRMRASSPTRMTSTSAFAGGPLDGAANHFLGGVIAAHGIDRNAGSRQGPFALVTLQRCLIHTCLSVPDPVSR